MTRPARTARTIAIAAASLFVLSAALGAAASAAAVAPGHAALRAAHGLTGSTAASSTNWAGWAVTGAKGSVSDVKGSWVVPKIQGTCPSSNQYSSFWVGIDGFSSRSVEQTGTDSDCQGGSAVYYAWYEFYPNPSHLISAVSVSPGDVISAEVVFSGGHFTVKITDVTSNTAFSKTATVKGAARTSAEWIAEAPSSSGGVLPLADFGTVGFGANHTGVSGTSAATVGGVSGDIASFSSTYQIKMVNRAGTATKASTSALESDGASFTVTWVSAGP